MATKLDVVNACLAIMGEAPLNVLTEDHTFKEAALKYFEDNNRTIQARGWWFNTERLTLTASPVDKRVTLPGDTGAWAANDNTHPRERYVQRGRRLYDMHDGTDLFPDGFRITGTLTRIIPFEDLPLSVSAYIERKTVLDFQNQYDGDQTKTRNLLIEVYGGALNNVMMLGLKGQAEAEHIRSVRMNFIEENPRLGAIRRRVNAVRWNR